MKARMSAAKLLPGKWQECCQGAGSSGMSVTTNGSVWQCVHVQASVLRRGDIRPCQRLAPSWMLHAQAPGTACTGKNGGTTSRSKGEQ